MTWGAGGPNGGGAGAYDGLTVGNFDVTNDGFGAMVTGPSTVNMFIQITDAGSPPNFLFGYAPQSTDRYNILADLSSSSDDTFTAAYADTGCNVSYPSITVPNVTGPWIMYTMMMTSTGIKLYVNGILLIDQAASLWCVESNPFYIGSNFAPYAWVGSISNIGYWTRELTPAEITQLYNGGLGLTAAEL